MMDLSQKLLLNDKQIGQRVDRIAFQLFEDNADEKEIILAGILHTGYQLAEKIAAVLNKIAPFNVKLIALKIDKHSQVATTIALPIPIHELQGKVVVLVDDVLNSGKTMMYAMKPFLDADIKKIRTVVLVDRNHRRYPIAADFIGLSLATTLQEHISAAFENNQAMVYLG